MRFDKHGWGFHGSETIDNRQFVHAYCMNENGTHITYLEAMDTIASFIVTHPSEFVIANASMNYNGEPYLNAGLDDATINNKYRASPYNLDYDIIPSIGYLEPNVGQLRGRVIKSVSGFPSVPNPIPRHSWNTTMLGAYKIWSEINLVLSNQDVKNAILEGGEYTESLNFVGWNISNLRNNPRQVARFINNLVIGKLKKFQLDSNEIIGWWNFDTDYGDLEPDHNIAAAIYLVNNFPSLS